MNYFEMYPGDYRRDTARLSLAEHGAYLLLMADYYASEKPLPADLGSLCRIVGAQGKAEQQAVKTVAEEYFPIADDGLRHNGRADKEIAKAQKRIDSARKNGAKGGRKPLQNETERKPTGLPGGLPTGVPAGVPSGEPTLVKLSTRHTPEDQKQSPDGDLSASASPPAVPPCPQQDIIGLYHEILPELRRVRVWNGERPKLLTARWREDRERQSLGWWAEFFGYVRKSDFLMGRTTGRDGRPFDCDLEWLIRPKNFAKVIEGKYEDASA